MPFFPTPPVHGGDDDINVSGSVRRLVGNRNYTRQGRFGEGRVPADFEPIPRRGLGVGRFLRKLFRRH